MIRVVHPGSWIRILLFTHLGSRGQKGTGSQIRIRNTGINVIDPTLWCVAHWMTFLRMAAFTLGRGTTSSSYSRTALIEVLSGSLFPSTNCATCLTIPTLLRIRICQDPIISNLFCRFGFWGLECSNFVNFFYSCFHEKVKKNILRCFTPTYFLKKLESNYKQFCGQVKTVFLSA